MERRTALLLQRPLHHWFCLFSRCSLLTHDWLVRACRARPTEPFRLNFERPFWQFCSQDPNISTPPARGEPLKQVMQRIDPPGLLASASSTGCLLEDRQSSRAGLQVSRPELASKGPRSLTVVSALRETHTQSTRGQEWNMHNSSFHPKNLAIAGATCVCGAGERAFPH
jgi:hypothetical protein